MSSQASTGTPCPTPEGIGAKIGEGLADQLATVRVPNARRHRREDRLADGGRALIDHRVPNGRRHRREDRPSALAAPVPRSVMCPTPEGIGAKIGSVRSPVGVPPGVPNARRHRREDRALDHATEEQGLGVPNARRHRREDRTTTFTAPSKGSARCPTPEGIGAKIGW